MEDRHTRMLRQELHKLAVSFRRKQAHMLQERTAFIRKQNLPAPTVIMERPASPVFSAHGDDVESDDRPRYMRPTKSKPRPRSTIATIDMFRVKNKKKVNTWEEVLLDKAEPEYESMTHPTMPLSTEDQERLQNRRGAQRGRRAHSANITNGRRRPGTTQSTTSSTFITQFNSQTAKAPLPTDTPGDREQAESQLVEPNAEAKPNDAMINPKVPVVTFTLKKRVKSSRPSPNVQNVSSKTDTGLRRPTTVPARVLAERNASMLMKKFAEANKPENSHNVPNENFYTTTEKLFQFQPSNKVQAGSTSSNMSTHQSYRLKSASSATLTDSAKRLNNNSTYSSNIHSSSFLSLLVDNN